MCAYASSQERDTDQRDLFVSGIESRLDHLAAEADGLMELVEPMCEECREFKEIACELLWSNADRAASIDEYVEEVAVLKHELAKTRNSVSDIDSERDCREPATWWGWRPPRAAAAVATPLLLAALVSLWP